MQQSARTFSKRSLSNKSSVTVRTNSTRRSQASEAATVVLEMRPGQSVHFEMEADRAVSKSMPSATTALDWLRSNESRLRHEVAQDLKKTILLEWNLGEDLDLCKFQESINLHSIFLRSDQSWELYYEDGDIFGGQIVVGETDSEGSLKKVYLAA